MNTKGRCESHNGLFYSPWKGASFMSNVTDMFTPLPRELIKGQPKYQCILKDQECSFWYSPPTQKTNLLFLLHDEHGNPWDCGKYKKFECTPTNSMSF